MNLISFVFCILLTLSLGAIVGLQHQTTAHRIYSTYIGHTKAYRHLLNSRERKIYRSIPNMPSKEVTSKPSSSKKKEKQPPKEWKWPRINLPCARLNLYSLLHQSQQQSKDVNELVFHKMLETFYGNTLLARFPGGAEKFLREWIKAAAKINQLTSLEQVCFSDPALQMLYYRMLKGTKKANLLEKTGYPSLLEYVKIEPMKSHLCLYHAHPNLLCALFSVQSAEKICHKLHHTTERITSFEEIERICKETRSPSLPADLFSLVQFKQCSGHNQRNVILIAEDDATQIVLQQPVVLPKN